MNKLILMICCIFIFTGCSTNDKDEISLKGYDEYAEILMQNDDFKEESAMFNTTLILNHLQDNTTRYDLIINHPKERLNNIKVLCIEENNQNSMHPSIGVYENENFVLDPNIKDENNNIYKGINLSGISQKREIVLKILVEYQNSNNVTVREYIKIKKVLEE